MSAKLLDIRDLQVGLSAQTGYRPLLKGIDLSVAAGETVGLVGESGSGKSLTAGAVLGTLPRDVFEFASGSILLGDKELIDRQPAAMRDILGREIGVIFQDPMTYLNPVLKIGRQLGDILKYKTDLDANQRRTRVLELLEQVRIRNPEQVASSFPHQLSGGMRQRVVIAGAIATRPRLIIADEPTTALDVSVQASILKLLNETIAEMNSSLLLISHDMGVIGGMCDRVYVMQKGEIVETGVTDQIFSRPSHEYTRTLLSATRQAPAPAAARPAEEGGEHRRELMEVVKLEKTFHKRGLFSGHAATRAVRDVSFKLYPGETFALVGESGSGKSTVGRMMVNLMQPTGGECLLEGKSIYHRTTDETFALKRRMQIVFQDPFASLNPRKTIGHILGQPLAVHEGGRPQDYRANAVAMLEQVGLPDPQGVLARLPHEFSGGQRQRIAIARALMLQPDIIVADEAVSSLDPSIRQQILDLFADLQRDMKLTYLFITHDISVVRAIGQRVGVMQHGSLREIGEVEKVLSDPSDEYTAMLLAATPSGDPATARRQFNKKTAN